MRARATIEQNTGRTYLVETEPDRPARNEQGRHGGGNHRNKWSANIDGVDLDTKRSVGAVGAADRLGGGEGSGQGGAGGAVDA